MSKLECAKCQETASDGCCPKCGGCDLREKQHYMSEHDTLQSKLDLRDHEIHLPLVSGMVSKNPFLSKAQNSYMHANPSILGKKGLKEWEGATDYKTLPAKVKKGK